MLSKKLQPKASYNALATIAGIITTIVGLLVLIGWQFDIAILKSILPGAVPMKVNTAAAFLLSGVALLLIQRLVTANKTLVRVFALIITLTGFLTLCQYLFSWNLGIDELLFRDSIGAADTSHPERMALSTALNFIMLGIAFYILSLQKYRINYLIIFSLFFALTISVISFSGYFTGFKELSGPLSFTRMAIHTSITFIILGLGMLSVVYNQQAKKITIEQKTLIGFTVSITIIISIILLSVSSIQSLCQASSWVEHTQIIKQQLYIVQSGVIDLKTGGRGYLISGDEKYLEPVIKAKKDLPKLLDELNLLTRDEPRQQELLVSLNQLIKERVDYAELLYYTYKTKGDQAGVALFNTDKGGVLTDSIRAVIAKMFEEEDRILKIRHEAKEQQAEETLIIVSVGIGVCILLLSFLFLLLTKDISGRRKAENNLNESEGKFRNVFENSNVGKSLTTIDGKLRVNKEFCNIVGYSEEELSTLHWKEITHPDDIDENQRVVSSLIAGEKEDAHYQKRYLHKSGRIVWADLSTFLQKDRNGKPLYFITSIIDITGRKRIEDEIRTLNEELEQRVADRTADLKKTYNVLQESEEKLRTASLYARSLLEASLDPFVTISPDGKITDVNKATELVTGVNRDHLTGSDFSDYFTAPEKAREGYQQAFSHGFVVDYPLAIRHISGSVTEVLYNATVYSNEAGVVQGVFAAARDITERKRAEEQLIQAKIEWEETFNTISDMITVHDKDFNIIRANRAAEKLLKLPILDVMPGAKCFRYYHGKEAPPEGCPSCNCLQTGLPATFELFESHLDMFIEISVIPRFDSKHRLTGLIHVVRDITERKRAEEELLRAKEKAEAGNRLKTAFMNNISHEVRTPLNGILGFSNLITQPGITDEEKVEYYTLIKTSSNRLLNTISNYMDSSLIASGTMEVNRKSIDLHPMLHQLSDHFKPLCADKNLELHLKIPGKTEPITLHSDAELLRKALSHLLDNAVKFTATGEIAFGYVNKPGALEFFVKDTGSGISKEAQTRIFEDFIQEELSHTRGYEGSGLGLFIAQGFVRLLGGEMRVESEKGAGSTFFFTLPCEEKETGIITKTEGRQKAVLVEDLVILIAEDDESNFLFMKAVLMKTAVTLLSANNGEDAVNVCREHPEISLVLMDLKMPVMDGLEATRVIKTFRKNLPIIAITAFAMSGDEKRALNAGCDDYLAKPVTKEALLEKLKQFGVG